MFAFGPSVVGFSLCHFCSLRKFFIAFIYDMALFFEVSAYYFLLLYVLCLVLFR